MKSFLLAAAVFAVVPTTGCDSADAGETRAPGVLVQNPPDYPALTAPDTVVVGRPFTVTTFTAGGGCVRKGDTEVAVTSLMAEIRPFDLFVDPGPDGACPAFLTYYPHTATFAFQETGTATVRVLGAAEPSGFGPPLAAAPLVTVEKAVVVVAR